MKKIATTLENNYITCRLVGRTGNMMFQLAHAYAKSLEYNRQFVAPLGESSPFPFRDNLFRKIDFDIHFTPQSDKAAHISAPFQYVDLKPEDDKPTVFLGYYQSEKYFGKFTEGVRTLFSPPMEFVDKALKAYPFLNDSIVAAINVRRGDYLTQPTRHPVIGVDYIKEAINQLPSYDYLLVTSDDMEWCKNHIKGPKVVYNNPAMFWDHEGIWLLSLCDHFVISNSTHSWWGAWLSRSNNKTVIAPSTWVGPDITDDMTDVWCESWIKINTVYDNGVIHLA